MKYFDYFQWTRFECPLRALKIDENVFSRRNFIHIHNSTVVATRNRAQGNLEVAIHGRLCILSISLLTMDLCNSYNLG